MPIKQRLANRTIGNTAIPRIANHGTKSAQQTQHHPMVRGNRHAHRNGTHHQHPPDHARRRQHQQAANVKAYAATITNTANKAIQKSKRQAKLTTRACKPNQQQTDGEPATQNPDNTIGNSSSHPATSWQPSTTRNSASAYPYATEQANRRSPSAQGIGSIPANQERNHTVITAHRGLADKLMFTKLDQAREGDEFTITTLGETLTHQVQTIRTSPPTIIWINKHDASADRPPL
ncbi:MAG: sortase [Bifidobacterium pseudocatenulatum]